MQTDERLALLLSQAAESMCALLPTDSQAADADASTSASDPSWGARAFESRAQQWFAILNEVQYSLRTAVRHLRDAQLAPLTPPVGPEARQSGRAGSATRGHQISLLEAFVDISGTDGATFKIPTSATAARPLTSIPNSSLSLQALRERDHNWKQISQSLEEICKSRLQKSAQPDQADLLQGSHEGKDTDQMLLDALLNVAGLAS
jgi:hypothetical protein